MGLAALIARLTLDTTGYEAGVKRAQGVSDRFARNLDKDVSKKINRAFGLGGLIGAGYAIKRATFDYARELQDLASAQDVTVGQLLQMQRNAAEAGISFEQYRREIERTHKSLKAFANENISPSGGAQLGEASAGMLNRAGAKAGGLWQFFTRWLPAELSSNMLMFWQDVLGGNSLASLSRAIGQADPRATAALERMRNRPAPLPADLEIITPQGPPQTRDAFEVRRRLMNPEVNALQQVGLMAVSRDATVVELKTAVKVLQYVDGTLKKIESKMTDGTELRLAP